MGHDLLLSVLSVLAVSVAAIAVCQRIGLSPVLGYLATGILVGPHVFAWLHDPARIQDFAELGIVLLMFTVGLEISWSRLLAAKGMVLGLGNAQLLLTMLVFGVALLMLNEPVATSLIIGASLAMSSTAIVLKLLGEQMELSMPHGRIVVAILIFQDIAAVAFLVMLPIIAADQANLATALIWALSKAGLLLLALLLIGRRMLPPLLHRVAGTYSQELFMATTLTMALAAAGLSLVLGLSATLGAFMAGTLLGETLFRHQIEADIRPFRDLMLGVFFITIGMQLDTGTLLTSPVSVLATIAALLLGKAVIMVPLIRLFQQSSFVAWRAALSLAHGGEFSLLLVSLAMGMELIGTGTGQPILVGIVLSMVCATLLVRFNGVVAAMLSGTRPAELETGAETSIAEASTGLDKHVILCGYGRVGQNLAWLLEQEGITALSLDLDPDRVKQAEAAGFRVLYGDASRQEILHAAGIGRARALVVTFDDATVAERIVAHVHHRYPDLPLLVRSVRGRDDSSLTSAGAEVFHEGLEMSLAFAGHLLVLLGIPGTLVEARLNAIRAEDYAPIRTFFHDTNESSEQADDYPDQVRTVAITEDFYAVGRTLAEMSLTDKDVVIRAVRRGLLRIPVHKLNARLQAGDVVILQGDPESIERVIAYLADGVAVNTAAD